ncbi:peptidylprolyl isomerase [Bacillus sp. SCS-151]|uniref:peptidylprolyl isomerase n=1 Tax=Nanhaiella sioensis TaxID=3115293 RepID=UPI003977F181
MKKMIVMISSLFFILAACGTAEVKEENTSSDQVQQEQVDEENDEQQEENNEEQTEDQVEYPQLSDETTNFPIVEMKTTMGIITIKLFPEMAPKTVENFLTHSENGYYDGVTFHRVINDFMIQGGDPEGNGYGGESIYGQPFEDEFSRQLFNIRGALSMANSGPNTNGSQFFIVQNKNLPSGFEAELEKAGFPKEIIAYYVENGGTPHLDFKHTVFGQVIEGMDIVDAIANVEVGENDKPIEPVIIESISVIE